MSQCDTAITDLTRIHGHSKPGIWNLTDVSNSFTVTQAGDSVSETANNTITDSDTEESEFDIDSSSADCELVASESDSEL